MTSSCQIKQPLSGISNVKWIVLMGYYDDCQDPQLPLMHQTWCLGLPAFTPIETVFPCPCCTWCCSSAY